MGTRVEAIPLGLECFCWGPANETPEAIYVMFFEMKKGDVPFAHEPPNGHIFRVPQNPLVPCDFVYDNPAMNWRILLLLQAGAISLTLRQSDFPNFIYFADTTGPPPLPENFVFTNDYLTPVNNFAWDGYCVVFWMSSVITLADAWGFLDAPDLLFELFSAESPDIVVKFCSLSLGINTRLKIPT